jgi:basic amino acid/polyamine antiporter, APA family
MAELKKSLGFTDLTLLAIGATIGSGIFLTPASIAEVLPSPFWIMMVWVLGGIISLAGSLTYAELGAQFPGAGGLYVYLKEAYGDMWAFLYGWATLLVINTGSIAALAIAFAKYFAELLRLSGAGDVGGGGETVIALLGIIIVTVINLVGVKQAGFFSSLSTALKLGGIFILIGVGLFYATGVEIEWSTATTGKVGAFSGAIGVAMVSVLWSYGGWYHASFLAGEARNPRVTVPMAMIVGTIVITAVYLLTNYAYMALMPLSEIAAAKAPNPELATSAMSTVWVYGGIFVAGVIFISTFGTTGIYTLSAPRIYYAMANDGLFFKKLGELHPKYQTPLYSIGIQTVWAMVLILFFGTFENLINYVLTTEWVFLGMAGFAIFILRRRNLQREPNQFRTPLYPVLPIIFCTAAVLFVASQFREQPAQVLAGAIVILTGIGAYLCWQTVDKIRAFAIGALLPVIGSIIVAKKTEDPELLRYSFYGFIFCCFAQIMLVMYYFLTWGVFSPSTM